jgi:hypothetical protein
MGQLSDRSIIELGRQYHDAKQQLLVALQARRKAGRSTVVEADGVKVALRINVQREYSVKDLAAKLTTAVRNRVIVRKVDGRALSAAIKRGDVAQDDVDAALISATEQAPSVVVTVRP